MSQSRRRFLRILLLSGASVGLNSACASASTLQPTPSAAPAATATHAPLRPSATPVVVGTPIALATAETTGDAFVVQPLTRLGYMGTVAGLTAVTVQYRDYAGQVLSAQTVPVTDGAFAFQITTGGALGPATITLYDGERVVAEPRVIHTVDATSTLQTDVPRYGWLFEQTTSFLTQSARSYELDGVQINGYRSPDNPLFWLRDHVYQGRGFRYIESDVKSLLTAFAAAQRPDGSLPDWVDNPELLVEAGRKEVEADVEFLFVQGVYEAWQMSGDDAWMQEMLPHARAAIAYTTSDPLRWNAQYGLIRRPYTIDMWDFSYGPTTTHPETGVPAPRHWIDDETVWGIFHGDNTGLVQALRMLAVLEQRAGQPDAAKRYRAQADEIAARIVDVCWNGTFLRHFVPENPDWRAAGVDEATQLSLSNAYALNRNVLTGPMVQTVLAEYYRRGRANPAIALPWYSIDPPFPAGSYGLAGRPGEQPGEYVNGGFMPLVGGELARAAFGGNLEQFGFDTLEHYSVLVERFGGTYLWYHPNGQPGISGPDTLAVDGWGASAMLGALMEGAAGIVDPGFTFLAVKIAPRWLHSAVQSAFVVARYPASSAYVAYQWARDARSLSLQTTGTSTFASITIPVPDDAPDNLQFFIDDVAQPAGALTVVADRRIIAIKISETSSVRGLHHTFRLEW